MTWRNDDGVDPTVTSLSGPAGFDSGQIAPGGAYSHRFAVVGSYIYHCADHSMMPTATVSVVPATTPTPTTHPKTHPSVAPTATASGTPASSVSTTSGSGGSHAALWSSQAADPTVRP